MKNLFLKAVNKFLSIMSYLTSLYKNQPSTLSAEVAAFIESPQNINDELDALKAIFENPSYEKVEAMFLIEILSQTLKQQQDFTKFVSIVITHIETIISYKNSIFILRIIKMLINTRFYLPVAYYLTKIMELSIVTTKISASGKKYSYDSIRLSSDDLTTEELQVFVIGECIRLVRKHCAMFGSSIAFPEYAFVVCNELRSKCKVGAFKEAIGDLIKMIIERKEYIEEERAKEKIDVVTGKMVVDFEANLRKWEMESS